MPGVYRPYTAADIIGSLQDGLDDLATSSTSSTSGVGFFGEADETITLIDPATGTIQTGDPVGWDQGQWGSLFWQEDGMLLELQATTGMAGFALQNGTPTILTWTPPSDGLMHRAVVFANERVTSTLTGGEVGIGWTGPDAIFNSGLLYSPGNAAGGYQNWWNLLLGPGGTVSIAQGSAMTGGAGTVWVEIWGS